MLFYCLLFRNVFFFFFKHEEIFKMRKSLLRFCFSGIFQQPRVLPSFYLSSSLTSSHRFESKRKIGGAQGTGFMNASEIRILDLESIQPIISSYTSTTMTTNNTDEETTTIKTTTTTTSIPTEAEASEQNQQTELVMGEITRLMRRVDRLVSTAPYTGGAMFVNVIEEARRQMTAIEESGLKKFEHVLPDQFVEKVREQIGEQRRKCLEILSNEDML